MTSLLKSILLGLAVGVLGLILGLSPLGLSIEERIGLDLLFTLRGAKKPPQDVLIISLDRQSADALNLVDDYRKWPRQLHAQLIEALRQEGASVIVFDMLFGEPRSPDEDKAFSAAVKKAGNVVLCCLLKTDLMTVGAKRKTSKKIVQTQEIVQPVRPLSDAAAGLAPFPLPKVPYKLSQYWTFKQDAGDAPTLPVAAFQVYALDAWKDFAWFLKRATNDRTGVLLTDYLRVEHAQELDQFMRDARGVFLRDHSLAGRMLAELDRTGLAVEDPVRFNKIRSLIRMYGSPHSHYLNLYGPARTIATIPYSEALQTYRMKVKPPGYMSVQGKAVFIGHAPKFQHEQKEMFFTVFSGPSGLDLSGVEIAATGFANILYDEHIEPLSISALGILLVAWGIGIGVVCKTLSTIRSFIAMLVLSLAYLGVILSIFTYSCHWYPLVVPIFIQAPLAFLCSFTWSYVDANRERHNIEQTLDLYLPRELVSKLAKDISTFNLPHQLVYGICLWTDAEQYTTLSEKLNPRELADFMNKYFQVLFEPVKRHGGAISNVVADSVLAIWVAPQPDKELRKKACSAALEISDAIDKFNITSGLSSLPTRIGIHSGHIFLGNVGAIDHYEYRPIGDIVNTATRIEGINKFTKTRILASSDAIYQLDGILTREIGLFLPVGKSTPLNLHELICHRHDATQEQIDGCVVFANALEDFRMRQWREATEKFIEAARCFNGDGASDFYIDLCNFYGQNPPGDWWDGVVRLERK